MKIARLTLGETIADVMRESVKRESMTHHVAGFSRRPGRGVFFRIRGPLFVVSGGMIA